MTNVFHVVFLIIEVSTHMPLARHDNYDTLATVDQLVSTHMPLARHDRATRTISIVCGVSTHMPLARHDTTSGTILYTVLRFYSHASCEA